MKSFLLSLLLFFFCGCRDIISPQLRRLPLSGVAGAEGKLILNAAGNRIVLFPASAAAVVNSIPVQLYDTVEVSSDRWHLAANSIENILLPLISADRVAVKKILLDPGHGGSDAGAVSSAGIREKELNLALAKAIGKELKNAGFQVLFTRSDDRFITLDNRAAMIKRFQADLFISIHHNSSASNPAASGMETFALKAGDDSERAVSRASHRLAYFIQQEQSGVNQSPGRGVKHARFRVLRQSWCPAVLIEAGFVSNPVEVQRCASEEHQKLIALAVARAVKRFATAK